MRRYLHLIFLLSLTWVCADETPNTSEGPSTTEAAIELALPAPARDEAPQVSVVAEDKSIVSVLGYHDFAHKQKATEMLLPTAEFRKQLQKIKDMGLKVISLEEFLDWKNGTGTLPAHSVLITIDDGWRTVYTHAFPILKEFGYPFTIYLYKDFIDTGSRSLTPKMLRERPELGRDGYEVGDKVPGRILHARYSRYMQKIAEVEPQLVASAAPVVPQCC